MKRALALTLTAAAIASTPAAGAQTPTPTVAQSCRTVIALALTENVKASASILAAEQLLLKAMATSRSAPLSNTEAAEFIQAAKKLTTLEESLSLHGSTTAALSKTGTACWNWALLGK